MKSGGFVGVIPLFIVAPIVSVFFSMKSSLTQLKTYLRAEHFLYFNISRI